MVFRVQISSPYCTVLQVHTPSIELFFARFLQTQEVESLKIAAQAELKSLLQSHFPQVKVADSSDFKTWAKNFFAKIDEEAQARESSSSNKSDTETLEKQANHYKAILSETVR